MKHIPSFRFILPIVALALTAGTVTAQYPGRFFPEDGTIPNNGPSAGIGKRLIDTGNRDSAKNPKSTFGNGRVFGVSGDSYTLATASNRNLDSAVTPRNQLQRFMDLLSFNSFLFTDNGFDDRDRVFGAYVRTRNLSSGTNIGFGVRASRWNLRNRDAKVGRAIAINQNFSFVAGRNPNFNGGFFSNVAWKRRGFIGPFTLSEPPLSQRDGFERRFIIGRFDVPSDAFGDSRNRFVSTVVANLTDANRSNIFIIPRNQENRFLNGNGFDFFVKYNQGVISNRELRLPPGRTYSVAIRDGVDSGSQDSSDGAQAVFYGAFYR